VARGLQTILPAHSASEYELERVVHGQIKLRRIDGWRKIAAAPPAQEVVMRRIVASLGAALMLAAKAPAEKKATNKK